MSQEIATTKKSSHRLFAIDALRGLIMILMALDHANFFIAQKHSTGEHWGGPFPVYYDVLAFITRLVTHPCAPGFSFLMGVGMMLFAESRKKRGWSKWAIWRDLWIRGALLIALQFFVVNRGWEMAPQGWGIDLYWGVLACLGGGMILGSLLIWLPWQALAGIALVLFAGIEIAHPDPSQWGQIFEMPLGLILGYSGGTPELWSNYPVLTWLELVVFGLMFGRWLISDPRKAYKWALWLGGAFLAGFVVLRALDGFGNIRPRMGNSWMDWLNPVKYPPSMTFTLMTMGFNLIVLWGFSKLTGIARGIVKPLTVYGRVPLFFYLVHIFMYAGHARMFVPPGGTSIAAIYPIWLISLFALFLLCWLYEKVKYKQPFNLVLRYL